MTNHDSTEILNKITTIRKVLDHLVTRFDANFSADTFNFAKYSTLKLKQMLETKETQLEDVEDYLDDLKKRISSCRKLIRSVHRRL